MSDEFVSRREVTKQLGIHFHTVHAMARRGDIETIKVGTRKKYNVRKYLRDNNIESMLNRGQSICYCRVSSQKQKDDLNRQILQMHELYPNYRIISDIASGLNFKRKGLNEILDLAIAGKLSNLIVFHKDRLARFGYDMIETIVKKYSNIDITVLSNTTKKEPMTEITEDIVAIMNIYVAKINGMRKYS